MRLAFKISLALVWAFMWLVCIVGVSILTIGVAEAFLT